MLGCIKAFIGGSLIGVAGIVAFWFAFSLFFLDTIDVSIFWQRLDYWMVSAIGISLMANFIGNRNSFLMLATVCLGILFMNCWAEILVNGLDAMEGNTVLWLKLAVVDTLFPVIIGLTGINLIRRK